MIAAKLYRDIIRACTSRAILYMYSMGPGGDFELDHVTKYVMLFVYHNQPNLHIVAEVIVLCLGHSIPVHPGYGSISSKHECLRLTTTETKAKVLDCAECV